MDKQVLTGKELTNHVRAAITNDKEMNDFFSRIGEKSLGDALFLLGYNYNSIVKHIEKIWPWLGYESENMVLSLRAVLEEYRNKE